jgi:hypothetical protein
MSSKRTPIIGTRDHQEIPGLGLFKKRIIFSEAHRGPLNRVMILEVKPESLTIYTATCRLFPIGHKDCNMTVQADPQIICPPLIVIEAEIFREVTISEVII